MDRPTFLIIGAARSGTTTLHRYLGCHPDVFMSSPKEPVFFESEYPLGLEYYWRTYFSGWRGERVAGEARVANLLLPYVVPRIAESLPEARLIVILRDPVMRAYSHWWRKRCWGEEGLDFEDAVAENAHRLERGMTFTEPHAEALWRDYMRPGRRKARVRAYLDFGYYTQQLRRYFSHFPRERILILFHEDLLQNGPRLFKRCWDFVGAGTDNGPPVEQVRAENRARSRAAVLAKRIGRRFGLHEVGSSPLGDLAMGLLDPFGRRPPLSAAMRRWLTSHYSEENASLGSLIGMDVPAWARGDQET